MLVVKRRIGESIRVGGDVVVRVIDVHAGQVQLALSLAGHGRIVPREVAVVRRVGDIIRIAPDIVVRVAAVRGGQVRLGIDAPRATRIVRGELAALTETPTSTLEGEADREHFGSVGPRPEEQRWSMGDGCTRG